MVTVFEVDGIADVVFPPVVGPDVDTVVFLEVGGIIVGGSTASRAELGERSAASAQTSNKLMAALHFPKLKLLLQL